MRGPAVLPGPLTTGGGPRRPTRRDRFDTQVLEVVEALEHRWSEDLGAMELAVEEAPVLPEGWDETTVPLASLVRQGERVRLGVFRRPIELRAATPEDLSALILTVVVEQVAELLGRAPHEVDPRYDDDQDD